MLVLLFVLSLMGFVWFTRSITFSSKSFQSRAEFTVSECQQIPGNYYPLYLDSSINPTPGLVKDYYNNYCKKNENKPQWNGGFGKNAKCMTSTLVCSKSPVCWYADCIANISASTRCINRPVPISTCISAGVAPLLADPSVPAPYGRCAGPCYNGTKVGDCLAGYAKRCECDDHMIARYVDDAECKKLIPTSTPVPVRIIATNIPVQKPCRYGNQIVTANSTPYHYDVQNNYCIVDATTGSYVGYRCITTDYGLTFVKSAKDTEHYCVNAPTAVPDVPFTIPATVCGSNHTKWAADQTHCDYGKNLYLTYGSCTADKQYICRCDDAGKYTYPVLVNKPEECR